MELMKSVAGTKDVIEKTNLGRKAVAEQSTNDKVIDFSYQQSPTCSPSLGPLILKTEVDIEKNEVKIEMKRTECIFNFEDIFGNETIERKEEENEGKNEFGEGEETNLGLTEPEGIEKLSHVLERKLPSSEVIMKKEDIKEEENVQSGSGLAIDDTKKERKVKQEGKDRRRSSGKKDRRKVNEEKIKKKENNEVKKEFFNKLDNPMILKSDVDPIEGNEQKKYHEVPEEVVGNFVLTAQFLTAQVDQVMFTSLSGVF